METPTPTTTFRSKNCNLPFRADDRQVTVNNANLREWNMTAITKLKMRMLSLALGHSLRFVLSITLSALATLALFPAAASAQSNDTATQTYNREIVIRPGDTLSGIALRELGSAKLAEQVATANGYSLTKILIPGDAIVLPITLPVRDEYATIVFSKGDVQLNGKAVQIDDEFRLNDVIKTGATGYASLSFQTGTLINFQPNTEARLITLFCQPADDTCVIELATDQGTLTTDVRRDGNQPTDFRVQTPYASAAVRGTVFDINADSTGLRIGVTEGKVDLAATDTDQLVPLDTGFGSATAPGRPIGEPIELLPAPVFRFVPPRIAKGDYLRWFGLTDTPNYIVQIAASPNGVGVVHDTRVPSDLFILNDEIPTGDYSVLVRGVDPNGLLGFTALSPITVASVDTSIAPVNASIDRVDGNYRVAIIDGPEDAAGYEIQVASDFEFTDPLSVDVDETGVALVRLRTPELFARARVLLDRTTVGPFGEASTVND